MTGIGNLEIVVSGAARDEAEAEMLHRMGAALGVGIQVGRLAKAARLGRHPSQRRR